MHHRTALFHTVMHRAAPHHTTPHHTTLHRTTPHHTAPHHTAPHHAALHCTAPHTAFQEARNPFAPSSRLTLRAICFYFLGMSVWLHRSGRVCVPGACLVPSEARTECWNLYCGIGEADNSLESRCVCWELLLSRPCRRSLKRQTPCTSLPALGPSL